MKINQAKPYQEGTYTLSIKENKITLTKSLVETNGLNYNMKIFESCAQCDPEDEFDVVKGFQIVMERLNKQLKPCNKITLGDIVRIKNNELVYTRYIDWVAQNIKDIKLGLCYMYYDIPKSNSEDIYEVKYIASHLTYPNKKLAFIQKQQKNCNNTVSPCYLIVVEGLELV